MADSWALGWVEYWACEMALQKAAGKVDKTAYSTAAARDETRAGTMAEQKVG